jgi:hypothetical protein
MRVLANWMQRTTMLEGVKPENGEGTWQAPEPALEERLSWVKKCSKRAPDLALPAQGVARADS